MTYLDRYKDIFRVKTSRLHLWDYSSQGYYFLTICVKGRQCVLGEIKNGHSILSEIGRIVEKCWHGIPNHFGNVQIDEFVVMPNHVHGIVYIKNNIHHNRRDVINHVSTKILNPTPMGTGHLGEIIRWFKGRSSFEIHKINKTFQWQSRYYDHVIRNEKTLYDIREYIRYNPLKWPTDEENPTLRKNED